MTELHETGKKEVRNFGLLFAAVCLGAGVYMVWKEKSAAWVAFSLSGLFLITGLLLPGILQPFHRMWMRLAALLAWLNTRLLLSVFFFLILTPIGLLMRLFGKDLLNHKINRPALTYWVKRDSVQKPKQSYEHLF